MPFDEAIDVVVDAAGAQSAAVSETNSSNMAIGPLPATGMTFNLFLKLNSGSMATRTATATLYMMGVTGGTFRDCGQVIFADGAASTTVGKHASIQFSRDFLSQVSGTVPSQITYMVSIKDNGTTGDAAVNYRLRCYPALQGWSAP